ncbi:MAG: lamin tail domain-containing protein, partial [Pseudomonadota bacterium]
MVDFLANGLAIAEILADNAGGQAIDTDGDGGSNKADEYVEIQNGFGTTVSLDGIEIWSQKDGLLYAFPDGETLAPGETATVVGEYTGTPPAGFYDAGGSANTNFL